MKKEIFMEGNVFSDVSGFYDEIERKFTKELGWSIGRNLNALNDILYGGFGVYECEESVIVKWLNSEKSKKELGNRINDQPFFEIIIEIFEEHKHIQLVLE